MDDTEFLLALRDYIEESEVAFQNEYGCCRSLKEMIDENDMPGIYAEVLRRIEACNGKKPSN